MDLQRGLGSKADSVAGTILVPFKGVYKGYKKRYYRGLVKYRVPFRVQEGVHTCRKFSGKSGNLKGITNAIDPEAPHTSTKAHETQEHPPGRGDCCRDGSPAAGIPCPSALNPKP